MPGSMKLSDILKDVQREHFGGPRDADVSGLHYDSRRIAAGGLFFALRGEKSDGRDFVPQALANGAAAVVTERPVSLPPDVAGYLVDNGRAAMARAAANFYGDPTADAATVGITGTNGKTTVAYLVESILRASGRRPALFGTVSYRFGDRVLPAPHTTPEAIELLGAMAEFQAAGADSLVMEVSSHALEQHRADGVHFRVGVFTNLTPEHLDYHRDMESYFASKRRLFSDLLMRDGGRAVVNVDDPYGERLAREIDGCLTCGLSAHARIRPLSVEMSLTGIRAQLTTPAGEMELTSALLGEFNLRNLLCAVGAGLALGIAPQDVARGLAEAPQIPGRLERVENERQAVALVDYAHTGDALEKALQAVAQLQPRQIITVFGCGGDRDPGKRPVMGEIAVRYSSLAVVTADNPRGEDVNEIIAQILPGCRRGGGRELSPAAGLPGEGGGFVVIPDRREAIEYAVSLLHPGDLLLIAGKGHEDYQIVGTERFHFDDREVLRSALGRKEASHEN